jgi:hypothetical protein
MVCSGNPASQSAAAPDFLKKIYFSGRNFSGGVVVALHRLSDCLAWVKPTGKMKMRFCIGGMRLIRCRHDGQIGHWHPRRGGDVIAICPEVNAALRSRFAQRVPYAFVVVVVALFRLRDKNEVLGASEFIGDRSHHLPIANGSPLVFSECGVYAEDAQSDDKG